MNCLQFFIFTRFFAVQNLNRKAYFWLWIAYNFLSLQGSLQLVGWLFLTAFSCELLTIFYLYKVLCSLGDWSKLAVWVVNCLQFFIFTRFFAVIISSSVLYKVLWIAYNFLSLQGSLQSIRQVSLAPLVVNCLQFFIFTRFFAVGNPATFKAFRLWIAYNFLSLQGSLQSKFCGCDFLTCCELLTIFYLYKVLCSCWKPNHTSIWLWIAYNFLSLQGSLQWSWRFKNSQTCCELLTIFYLYKVLCSWYQ